MHKLVGTHIAKRFKSTTVLHDISLEIASGEVVGLLGPNGAGKTTTFYIMCGLVEATEGSITLDGIDISSSPLSQRAKMGIGYLPQEASIFKDLSVEENLLIAAEVLVRDEEHQMRRIEKVMDQLDIEPIRYRKGVSLSGGERRRVEIGRALVNEPKFMFLDEPFAGVDPIAVIDIQNVIADLKQRGIGVVITDHNFRETLAICDRVYVLKDGALLASGTPAQIVDNPLVRTYYLGEQFGQ